MSTSHRRGVASLANALMVCLSVSLFVTQAEAAPKPKLSITTAKWAPKKGGALIIKGALAHGDASASIELYDINGKRLGTPTSGRRFSFTIPGSGLAIPGNTASGTAGFAVPCSVRVHSGNLDVTKVVAGNPDKGCVKAPKCQITAPATGTSVRMGDAVTFTATASFPKNKNATPKVEWDFGGGVMGEDITGSGLITTYKRPDSTQVTVSFVRDNSRYRVHFSAYDPSVAAMESRQYRCEDAVDITVGTPPADAPDMSAMVMQSQQSAPTATSQLQGNLNDIVVLPFVSWTMQSIGDGRTTLGPQGWSYYGATVLNAQVYQKAFRPPQLKAGEATLTYQAASNPNDPVGPESINSTSHNWPLQSDVTAVTPLINSTIQKSDLWESMWYMNGSTMTADAGFVTDGLTNPNFMPGHDDPFKSNAPQPFASYDEDNLRHTVKSIPMTDIDDSGAVNPFPLMRVQAVAGDKAAAADAVLATGKDFHCRGCHAKDRIAANSQFDWTPYPDAFHSSPQEGKPCDVVADPTCDPFTPPTFMDSKDINGKASNSLFDLESAALENTNQIHMFYDGAYVGMEMPCGKDCHQSLGGALLFGITANSLTGQPPNVTWGNSQTEDPLTVDYGVDPNSTSDSITMHRFHGRLQKDPNNPNQILRTSMGRPLRWDPTKGPNPNSLFPTVDAQGNSLPMEQSCLRCHSGHREQLYRDRMYTAGVTCYDCHGDMLAVGQAYHKPKSGPEGRLTREEWTDQPDCGSCHTGDANIGKDGTNGYFSAGVKKRAFDVNDPSATSLPPVNRRFAVQPGTPLDVPTNGPNGFAFPAGVRKLTLTTPLYQRSRDTHGDVACAACHGGAHEVWPNRDPNANDNVTALQLQGHTGPILECNVCHTADSFTTEANIDAGRYMTDVPNAGADNWVLGGPHNTHPINDPNWWQSASANGDVANTDTTTYGGWHNNYAKRQGIYQEDQCATCHGNDHLGTRLSRTPVDRVFDFSSVPKNQWNRMKKAGFKKKVIKVAAGSVIGCNTCHNIKTSCLNSPAGSQCGVASENVAQKVNHDPVFESQSNTVTDWIMDTSYTNHITATDPDGDKLTLFLADQPTQAAVDGDPAAISLLDHGDGSADVTTTWPSSIFMANQNPALPFVANIYTGPEPFQVPYKVTATDGRGGYATLTVMMNISCPEGQTWFFNTDFSTPTFFQGHCAVLSGIQITSLPSVTTIHPGEKYQYQVVATDQNGSPMSYQIGASTGNDGRGLSIDANGLVTWQTVATSPLGRHMFVVEITDAQGGYARQVVEYGICPTGQTWDSGMKMCM